MREVHSSSPIGHRKYTRTNLLDCQRISNICGLAVLYLGCASSRSPCGLDGGNFYHTDYPGFYLHEDLTFENEVDFVLEGQPEFGYDMGDQAM